MNIDEHLDKAFRQADAFREKAKVLGQEVERNPARTAARAREVIPVVMEQNRYHAAQIGGVDVANPDWSRAPAWKERAANLGFLDLSMVYQIGNNYLVFKRCREEIADLDSDRTLSEEVRAGKICESVLGTFEALSGAWLHELAELRAWVRLSDGVDSAAAKLAEHETARQLAGYLTTKISLNRNLRLAKALDEIRQRNKPASRERFEVLLRELYVEAPLVWAERSCTDWHLRATRSATLKKIEGRNRQGPSIETELAAFAEREALLRTDDPNLTRRENELFRFFIVNPSATNADAARALGGIAVGTVKSLKNRIKKHRSAA